MSKVGPMSHDCFDEWVFKFGIKENSEIKAVIIPIWGLTIH